MSPPKRKRRLGGRALNTDWNMLPCHRAPRLQAALRRRLNRPASIGEMMPAVLIITQAQISYSIARRRL